MTYLSEHSTCGQEGRHSCPRGATGRIDPQNRGDHRKLQPSLPNLDGRIVPIAMDEWNYWYRPYEYGELGCVYELRDALGVAVGSTNTSATATS